MVPAAPSAWKVEFAWALGAQAGVAFTDIGPRISMIPDSRVNSGRGPSEGSGWSGIGSAPDHEASSKPMMAVRRMGSWC